jgi:hypothetical protein
VLVRDFRDVACSILASSAKRKGEEPAEATAILEAIKSRAGAVARVWQQRSERAHLVRYEDLIQRPDEVMEELVTYIDVDSGEHSISAMVDALSQGGEAAEFHRTTSEVAASIGRWQRDLDADAQQQFTSALQQELEAFGY